MIDDVPGIITTHARGGAPFVYLFDIIPASGDAWSQKRFSTNAVNVAGDDYDDHRFKSFTRIVQSVDIEKGGNVAKMNGVDVTMLKTDDLHIDFHDEPICNRKGIISMTIASMNRCLNSSFEKYTGVDFDDWSNIVGGGGGGINQPDTSQYYDGAASCKMAPGATGNSITYPTSATAFEIKRGERFTLSLYLRGDSGGGGESIDVLITSNAKFWDESTGVFQSGVHYNNLAVATAQTWERFSLSFDWSDLIDAATINDESEAETVTIYIQTNTGTVYVDAIQIEPQPITTYHHNRFELVDADVFVLFTGIILDYKYDREKIKIKLDPWARHELREIPLHTLTTDWNSNWEIPSESKGKPFPITYGNFRYLEENFWDPYSNAGHLARGLLANIDPKLTDGIEIYFDRPDFASGVDHVGSFDQAELYHYDKKSGLYYPQRYDDAAAPTWVAREFDPDGAASRYKQNASAHWLKERRAPFMMTMKGEIEYLNDANISNHANAYDGDLTTHASMIVPSTSATMLFKLPQHELEHTIVIDDGVYFIGDVTIEAATANAATIEWRLNKLTHSRNSSFRTIITGAGPQSFRNADIVRILGLPAKNALQTASQLNTGAWYYWNFIRKIIDDSRLELEITSGAGAVDIRIHEVGLRIDYGIKVARANYAGQIWGREFQTTWNSRRSATGYIRETHDVIESILRHECGAVDGDIDMDAFDDMMITTSGGKVLPVPWKTGMQIHDLTDARDVIEKICYLGAHIYFIDNMGRHSIDKIQFYDVERTLTLADFKSPETSIKISMTKAENIATEIHYKFNKNQFEDDEFKNADFADGTGSTCGLNIYYRNKLAAALINAGGIPQPIYIEDDVIEVGGQYMFMRWLAEFFSQRKYIVDGNVWIEHADFELGDQIMLDLPTDYLPADVSTTSHFIVVEKRFKMSEKVVGYKFFELPEGHYGDTP